MSGNFDIKNLQGIKPDLIENKAISATQNVVKRYASILSAALVAVLATILMTDINFSLVWAISFGVRITVIIVFYNMMYTLQSQRGIEKGKEQGIYQSTRGDYERVTERLRNSGKDGLLDDWCEEAVISAENRKRTRILRSARVSEEEYDSNYELPMRRMSRNLSKRKRKAIRKASRVEFAPLNAEMLLEEDECKGRNSLLAPSPTKIRNARYATSMVSKTVTSFFMVSITFSVIRDPSPEDIVCAAVQILMLFWVGWQGFMMGYNNIVKDAVRFIQSQIGCLNQYWEWVTGKKEENEKSDEERNMKEG